MFASPAIGLTSAASVSIEALMKRIGMVAFLDVRVGNGKVRQNMSDRAHPASSSSYSVFATLARLTVALALMASASPVTTKTGIRIPFEKRSSLTNADGTFNHDKAIIESVKTLKYVLDVAYDVDKQC